MNYFLNKVPLFNIFVVSSIQQAENQLVHQNLLLSFLYAIKI